MQLYSRIGACSNGYYKNFFGVSNLQSCLRRCLNNDICMYVSFTDDGKRNEKCKGYMETACKLDITSKKDAKKIQIGKRHWLSIF